MFGLFKRKILKFDIVLYNLVQSLVSVYKKIYFIFSIINNL